MSSIKPEDRPKVIGLVGAIVVVFGVGGVNMAKQLGLFRSSAPAPETSTAAATPGPAQAPAGAPVASGVTGTAAMASALPLSNAPESLMTTRGGPDPFRPIALTVTATPGVPAPRSASGNPGTTGVTVRQIPSPGLPPVVFPIQPSGTSAPLTTLKPAPVPEPPLELVGVITGPDAIAMIRAGGNERFLNRGDIVAGYRIIRIEEDTVTLRRGNQGRKLRVGASGSEYVQLPPASLRQIPSAGTGSSAAPRPAVSHIAQSRPASQAPRVEAKPVVAVRRPPVTPTAPEIIIVPHPAVVSEASPTTHPAQNPATVPSDALPNLPSTPEAVPVPDVPQAAPEVPVVPVSPTDPQGNPLPIPVETPAVLPHPNIKPSQKDDREE